MTEEEIVDAVVAGHISDAEAKGLLAKIGAPMAAEHTPPPAFPSYKRDVQPWLDPLKTAGGHGAATLMGAGPDLYNTIGSLAGMVTGNPPTRKMPGGAEDQKSMWSGATGITLPEIKSFSQPQKYLYEGAKAGMEFLPASWKQAVTGITAGLAGEAAATGSTHPELMRMGGQAATLAAAAPFGMRTPNRIRAAKGFVDEIGGPEELKKLAEIAASASKELKNTPVMIPQAAKGAQLSGLAYALADSVEGGAMRKILRDQGFAGEEKIRSFIDNLTGGSSQADANKVLLGGKDVFTKAHDAVTSATESLYAQARKQMVDPNLPAAKVTAAALPDMLPGTIPGNMMESLANRIQSLDNSVPPKTITSAVLGPSGKPFTTTVPGKPAAVPSTALDLFAREAGDKIKVAGKETATSTDLSEKVGAVAAKKAILDEIAPPGSALAGAKALHKTLAEKLLDPLEKGPMNSLFSKGLRNEGIGKWDTFTGYFNKASSADIKDIAQRLDTDSFQAIVKKSWGEAAEQAFKPSDGRTPSDAINSFVNAVAGPQGSEKRASFLAAVEGIAAKTGQNVAEAVTGANKAMDALYVISRDRNLQRSAGGILDEASQSWFSRFLKSASFTAPLRSVGHTIEYVARKNLEEDLIKAFTTEEGIKELIKIANYSSRQDKAGKIARGLMVLQGGSQPRM